MSEHFAPAPHLDLILAGNGINEDVFTPATPPVPLTSFIGREREVAALHLLLVDECVRLVTLSGPGGAGKTRLALRMAELAAADFPGGVRFVLLAPVRESGLVASAIAGALGVREPGIAPLATRLRALSERGRVLLILDNFEHVVEAAPLATELLSACPTLTCLVTSRTVLQVSGEHSFPVLPLPLVPSAAATNAERAHQSAAVQLFVARAKATHPAFDLSDANAAQVTAICRRLDGLPLAIELAAARMRHLPLSELAARLGGADGTALRLLTTGPRDAPSRQQTLRATVAWSHDLLSPDEQALFRQLAAFIGGFTIEAAEQVVTFGVETGIDLGGGIASLVDQSLLFQAEGAAGEARYGMLETIREFGLERLAASGGEAGTRARHAAWCVALAETLGQGGGDQHAAGGVRRLASEWPNFRAAVRWALEHEDPSLVLRITRSVHDAVNGLGLGDPLEARQWLDAALAMGDRADLALRIDALSSASVYAGVEGDLDRAESLAEQALVLGRKHGDQQGEADALHALGLVASFRCDPDRMATIFEQALALRCALGDTALMGHTLGFLADAHLGKGDIDRAEHLAEEAQILLDQTGNESFQARLRGTQGAIALARRDVREAAALYRDYLERATSFGNARYIADALAGLAALAEIMGDTGAAVRLLGAAAGQMEAVGARSMIHSLTYQRSVEDACAVLTEQAFAAAWEAGRALGRDAAAAGFAVASAVEAERAPAKVACSPFSLTPREQEVLRLIVEGRSDQEIGEMLFISRRTASKHVGSILSKLAVTSRAQAAVQAIHKQLV